MCIYAIMIRVQTRDVEQSKEAKDRFEENFTPFFYGAICSGARGNQDT